MSQHYRDPLPASFRERAIFQGLWRLNENDLQYLDFQALLQTDVRTLLQKIDRTIHDFKDILLIPIKREQLLAVFEVHYYNCGYDMIYEDLKPEHKLVLSLRYCEKNNIAIALVRSDYELRDGKEETVRWL